jgi:tetratricopeptide (TPR) repeat protein
MEVNEIMGEVLFTNNTEARVWVENVIIPTYEIGEAEKNPIFLDKRVYQGSSGKVYPYPTIEKISDVKVDKEYTAVMLENKYLKVMVLPELGGRIQRAFDKTNGYDFVYYNRVIKPALVGLTGPWISGGIEFNWPQHHRPTTFMPVDYMLSDNEDGSKSVLLHDVDQMYGTKGLMKFTLYPDKAYIEIVGQLYNCTSLPQTFLWWANPAVAVNDDTQSIFPPDVHAVMDHGKRDVSRFPIATGIYYKKDYSEGVDISRYKNIPVPTSYMAEKSKYDFMGGYDYGKKAGILHVADHHISPGKKQWTWGCGDFGKAWDRNLTDEDGPYVELMTGVYTDNQPDFTWLKPFEEKTFKQYFMPYKELGQVKNATTECAVHLSIHGAQANVKVYATGLYEDAKVVLKAQHLGDLKEETVLLDVRVKLSPLDIYETIVDCMGIKEEELYLAVYDKYEHRLVDYQPEKQEIPELPEPAKAAKDPKDIMTNEELYLNGLHIEQYRHATYLPDPYYLEGLKRDPGDIRINNAYGALLMRRGQFIDAETYFRTALKRLITRNPNPYNSESYYLLGLDLFYQNRFDESYDAFFKASWSNEQKEMSYYYLAAIDARGGRYKKAYEHIEKALINNAHNIKARGLKAYLLRKLGMMQGALLWIQQNLNVDPFDYISLNEKCILSKDKVMVTLKREACLMTARDYAEFGGYDEAIDLLNQCMNTPSHISPMLYYYLAYYKHMRMIAEDSSTIPADLQSAEEASSDYCFPNKLEDIAVLRFAIEQGCKFRAPYYLGNLLYDKLQYKEAVRMWEMSAKENPNFPTVHRNLALAYYNKIANRQDKNDIAITRASEELELAFSLNPSDVRIFLELDQLHKKLNWSFIDRCKDYEQHQELLEQRDDLYIEYITLLNMTGNYEKAYKLMMNHHFHPWEGGEGKVTTQYTISLVEMAKEALKKAESSLSDFLHKDSQDLIMDREHLYHKAEGLLRNALDYPQNLGEGKLEGTKDNHIYYYLGIVLEKERLLEEAKYCFEKATIGTDEPAGAMYYNDQPADMILYQGLAYLKLGEIREAKSRFYRLIDYGEQHLYDDMRIEYFAVSLPEFQIFDEDLNARNKAHCYYLIALGNIGLMHVDEAYIDQAKEYLHQACTVEPSHMMCRIYEKMLE